MDIMGKVEGAPMEGDGKISPLWWGLMGGGDAMDGTTFMEKTSPQQSSPETNDPLNHAPGAGAPLPIANNWMEIERFITEFMMQKMDTIVERTIEAVIKRYADRIRETVVSRIETHAAVVPNEAQGMSSDCTSSEESDEVSSNASSEEFQVVSSAAYTSESSSLDSRDDEITFKKWKKAMKARKAMKKRKSPRATAPEQEDYPRTGLPLVDMSRPPPGYPALPRCDQQLSSERRPMQGRGGQQLVHPPIHPPRKQIRFGGQVGKKNGKCHGYPSGNGPNTLGTKEVRALARLNPHHCLKCGAFEAHFARECPVYTGHMAEKCIECGWYHEEECKSKCND